MKRMRFLMLLVAAVTFGFIGCQPAVEPVAPGGEDEDVNTLAPVEAAPSTIFIPAISLSA